MTKAPRLEIKSYNKPILSQIMQTKICYDKVKLKLKNLVSVYLLGLNFFIVGLFYIQSQLCPCFLYTNKVGYFSERK